MLELLEYTNEYEKNTIDLILEIQQKEFGFYLQVEHQEELLTLNTYFKNDHSQFWIIPEKKSMNIVGCIGLKVIDNIGIVKKMYIKKEYRGKNIGVSTLLLNVVLQHASKHQLSYLCLGTNDELVGAKRFYEKNGWDRINRKDLPNNVLSAFNIADNVLYKYNLSYQQ
ncbi:unnamed protein product [Cunninghamella blakesleeana]